MVGVVGSSPIAPTSFAQPVEETGETVMKLRTHTETL